MRYAATVLLTIGLSLTGALAHGHGYDDEAHNDEAHDSGSSVQYIANEGLMAQSGDVKILFDPFQVSGFGTYQEPRASDLSDMMAGKGAFAGIDAIFVSHAHRDHFSAPQMLDYMRAQSDVHLIAPRQALDMMKAEPDWDADLLTRMSILDMNYGDAPQSITLEGIEATAIRIAHAGWPAQHRKVVQNMVYRVTLNKAVTVMHMGDADPRAQHFAPFTAHWEAQATDTAFPPYWFLTSDNGQGILRGINVKCSIAIHVPIIVPEVLAASDADYFSVLGETREIGE